MVSIHAPARGATRRQPQRRTRPRFQSTPPRGGRPATFYRARFESVFQSTPPRGGRREACCRSRGSAVFQSTPPRGGRLDSGGHHTERVYVSIHAPARGATRLLQPFLRMDMFQSTPPRGGRHASSGTVHQWMLFQSTPPRGGRPGSAAIVFTVTSFQSTPPRGGRPSPVHRRTCRKSFNPRPREGGDYGCPAGKNGACPFQSTPPRGGRRPQPIVDLPTQSVSIHAPARGATPARRPARAGTQSFNPRPREGGDAREACCCTCCNSFNPRPREGGDLPRKSTSD